MLARKYRLPVTEFKAKPQETISTPLFRLRVAKNNLSHNRAGVIISGKAIKSASQRNFWKRRLLENVKTWPPLGKDFLFIVTPKMSGLNPADLQRELKLIIQKVK
jgi:ribonuclease P protein component